MFSETSSPLNSLKSNPLMPPFLTMSAMSGLRVRILGAVGIIFCLMFLGQFAIVRGIFLHHARNLENDLARRNLERLRESLDQSLEGLANSAADEAKWDATYRFVNNPHLDYLKEDLPITTFLENHLNILVIAKLTGRIVYGQGFDFRHQTYRPLSQQFLAQLTPGSPILATADTSTVIRGVWMLPEGPLMVASAPILNSNGQGAVRGSLIMGRFLDAAVVDQLAAKTRLNLQIYPYDHANLPRDIQTAKSQVSRQSPFLSVALDQQTFASYWLIEDLEQNPVLIIRAESDRQIYAQARANTQLYFWSTLLTGIVFCGVSFYLIEQVILSRLSQLSSTMEHIGASQDFSQRLYLSGNDQLSNLATTINWTLNKLSQAQTALRNSEERYALAARGANDGLWDWDLTTHELYLSPRWLAIIGYADKTSASHEASSSDTLLGESQFSMEFWFQRIHVKDLNRFKVALMEHLEGLTAKFQVEFRMLHKDGCYRWVLCRGLAIHATPNQVNRIAGSLTDLSQSQKLYEELTGLPNRTLFLEYVRNALKQLKQNPDSSFAVLLLDCDRFRLINDSLGPLLGDQLIQSVARRLESCLRPADILARVGSGEFIILLHNLSSSMVTVQVTQRINQALAQPINLPGHLTYVSVSTGIVLGTPESFSEQSVDQANQPEDILRQADMAVNYAKTLGKGQYAIFEPSMQTQRQHHWQIETDLRQALTHQQFDLYYQPIIALKTLKLSGFEVLLRWRHPKKGLISPDQFIPIAEETDLIVSIGIWIIDQACQQLHQWQHQFDLDPSFSLCVNVSRRQLTQPNFDQEIAQILAKAQIPAQSLKLEVTETILATDDLAATALLHKLQKMGIQISLDDFGTGYSSLSYLDRFPLNTLKIDRAFVDKLSHAPESSEIIQTIIRLAQTLNLDVVAEGIETPIQMARLKQLGCDYVQGYLLSKPLDVNAAEQYMGEEGLPPHPEKLASSELTVKG